MKNKTGFTLVELLVVIAIIGILSTVLLVQFSTSRAKARDVKRTEDIRDLRIALEMYANANGFYPNTGGGSVNNCDGSTTFDTGLSSLITNKLLTRIPNDSLGTSPYCFSYQSPANDNDCPGSAGKQFVLVFATEVLTTNSYITYINTGGATGGRYCFFPNY